MMAIQIVERVFDILETLAIYPNGVGVRELAREVHLPKSTVSRLLLTLEEIGIVERDKTSDQFVIGVRLNDIAIPPQFPKNLIAIARPYMLELSSKTGEDIALAILEGDSDHYIEQIQSEQSAIQVKQWVGKKYPLNATSCGKLFLAFKSAEFLDEYLARPLTKFSENTITDPTILRRELAKIRTNGMVWSFGEFAEGFVGAGAPIFDKAGRVFAAISIFAPEFRFPRENKAKISKELLGAGRKISKKVQLLM